MSDVPPPPPAPGSVPAPPQPQTDAQQPYGTPQPQPYGTPQPQPYGTPPAYAAGYAYGPRTNTLAIVALVLAFAVPLGGIICGHIALSQLKRTGEAGHGLALAGTVLGYVFTGMIVLFVIAYVIIIVVVIGVAGVASTYPS